MLHEIEELQKKSFLQYRIDRGLVEMRDMFVILMSRNCYESADADRLDAVLEQVYRSGKITGQRYVIDRVKTALTD